MPRTDAVRTLEKIVAIIRDEEELLQHQRGSGAHINTIHDGMMFAYCQIVEVIKPYLDEK